MPCAPGSVAVGPVGLEPTTYGNLPEHSWAIIKGPLTCINDCQCLSWPVDVVAACVPI